MKKEINKCKLYSSLQEGVDFNSIPLSSYPRMQFKRDSYICLNGKWDLSIIEKGKVVYQGNVMIPYAIESSLSGVNRAFSKDATYIYSKKINVPSNFTKDKIIINFEGVDQVCKVFVDEKEVKENHFPYLPFQVEVEVFKRSFNLRVEVKDYTDSYYYSRGKQVLKPHSFSYSSSSGIYKNVYMESVPSTYITKLDLYPSYDKRTLKFNIHSNKDEKEGKIYIDEKEYEFITNMDMEIDLPHFSPWDISSPYLYKVRVVLEDDEVESYFGLRKIEIRKDKQGIRRIYLNNKPQFLLGLLDQGYYLDGNLTPKSYSDFLKDIQLAKRLGFNCLRIHVKVEMDYFYYLADKEGIYLIQDFPNGGRSYHFYNIAIPRLFPSKSKEQNINYKKMSREDKQGREDFKFEANSYLDNLKNHPSILIWTIFNEGWGEFDPSLIYSQLKAKYPTFLFDTASGWYDANSDFFSIHTYTLPSLKRKDKKNRCFIISEGGGVSYKVKNHSLFKGFFGHQVAFSFKSFTKKNVKLISKVFYKQVQSLGLSGLILTQLSDVETEYNGFVTFDRKVIKGDEKLIKEACEKLLSSLEVD